MSLDQIEKDHGGQAILAPTNVISLNAFDRYLSELAVRVKEGQDA